MKACKRCNSKAGFMLENVFYCQKCVGKISSSSVPIRIVSEDDEWKRVHIRKKVNKRLAKISELNAQLCKMTAKILKNIQELHLESTNKLREKFLHLLSLANTDDLDSAYQQLNNKFCCGLLKNSPNMEEFTLFYRQEFTAEKEINKFRKVPKLLNEKKSWLAKKFSLFVEDFKPPALFLTGSQDNSQLILADSQDSIHFFSLTKKIQENCIENSHPIKYLQVFDNDSKLAAVSNTGSILIWRVSDCKLIHEFNLSDSEILTCLGTQECLFFSSMNLKLSAFNFVSLEIQHLFEYTSEINIFCESYNQNQLICACSNKEVLIINTLTKETRTLLTGSTTLTALDSSKNKDLAVLAFANKTVQVWSTDDPKCIFSIPGHTDFITSVIITPDDSSIITFSNDKKYRIFSIQSRRMEFISQNALNKFSCVFLSADKKQLFIAAGDVKVLSLIEKKTVDFKLSNAHSNAVSCIEFTKNLKKAVTGSKDKTIKVWKIKKRKIVMNLAGHTDEVTELLFTENENFLVSASNDKTIRVWSLDDAKQVTQCNLTSKALKTWVDKFNSLIITMCEDKQIRVLAFSSGKIIFQFIVNAIVLCKFLVLNDGQQVIVACEDKSIKVLNTSDKKVEKTLTSHQQPIISIDTNQFVNIFASCSLDGLIKIWCKSNFELLYSLNTSKSPIQIVLSNDQKYLAVKHEDNSVDIFDIANKCKFDSVMQGNSSCWLKRYPELVY